MRWYVNHLGEFYNCGEDTSVYFDPSSGDTHLISQFAVYLLEQLSTQPLDLEQLNEQISRDIDPLDLPDLLPAVPDALGELVALDVVQQL